MTINREDAASGPTGLRQGSDRYWWVWCRFQRAAALLLLVLLSPVLAILAIAVRLDSPGPALYRQRRPGRYGQEFTAWKFRSMTVGADRNPMLARAVTAQTPEVTRVGRIIRDLKLDELPQLWNVARGDMQLVGPRPIATSLQSHLEQHIPGFAQRLSVPPGLTSLGQVCIEGNEDAERVVQDWNVRFEAERHYLANRSVSYDLVILGITAAYVLRKMFRPLASVSLLAAPRVTTMALLVVGLVVVVGCAEQQPRELEWRDGARSRIVRGNSLEHRDAVVSRESVMVSTLPTADSDPVYRLGVGDKLAINVFGEPGMENIPVQVDGDGTIQLPMLRNVDARGLSLVELQSELEKGYATQFKEPWVTVRLTEPLSRPLYLLGEFNRPGIVHMNGPTNVIQALGAGSGLTTGAYTRGARLIRDQRVLPVDINALLNRGRLDQNVWLQADDTLFVPASSEMRIFVLGAVAQPGAQPVGDSVPTLAEAIARSGGPRDGEAQLCAVRVIRAESPVEGELLVIDFTRVLRGEAMDVVLQPGDIVYLPVNKIGGWNDVIKAISPTVMMLGRALEPFVIAKTLEGQ